MSAVGELTVSFPSRNERSFGGEADVDDSLEGNLRNELASDGVDDGDAVEDGG